jgi:hypothetical protein
MVDHRDTSDAIRNAVRGEDPAAWGTRTGSHGGVAGPHDTSMHQGTLHHGAAQEGPMHQQGGGARAHDPHARGMLGGGFLGRRRAMRQHDHHVDAAVPGAVAAGVRAEAPVERRRFSLGATFLGWSVAAFFTLVFSAIVVALTGGQAFTTLDSAAGMAQLLTASFLGYLAATFLAYLIGGYAAGRIALWDGVKHGLGIVVWSILFAILAIVAGTAIADQLNLGAGLPIDPAALTGAAIAAIALTLLVQLLGAAFGGRLGERYHDRVHGIDRRAGRRSLRGRRYA